MKLICSLVLLILLALVPQAGACHQVQAVVVVQPVVLSSATLVTPAVATVQLQTAVPVVPIVQAVFVPAVQQVIVREKVIVEQVRRQKVRVNVRVR